MLGGGELALRLAPFLAGLLSLPLFYLVARELVGRKEALAALRTYGGYFGSFSVNEDDGYLVHHRIGGVRPSAAGSDAQRFYELTATHLTLQPPAGTDDEGRAVQSRLRWRRISE